MGEFFTVDRRASLTPGQSITNLAYLPEEIYSRKGLTEGSEIRRILDTMFPEGLSPHGGYLWDEILVPNPAAAAPPYLPLAAPIEPLLEVLFELVRRCAHSDKPSRFQSLFGWESSERAERFRSEKGSTAPLYRVECDAFFLADMKLLLLGRNVLDALSYAETYWDGRGSDAPDWEILMQPPIIVRERIG